MTKKNMLLININKHVLFLVYNYFTLFREGVLLMKYTKVIQFFSIMLILLTSLGVSTLAVNAQEPTDFDQDAENITIAENW